MTYDKPPESIMIDGVEYPINTDFRIWMKFYKAAQKREGLEDFFEQLALPFSQSAANAVCDFYAEPMKYGAGKDTGEKVFDFDVDAPSIYSSFFSTYEIDLTEVEGLHWWKFISLLRSLPDDCEFKRIVHYRGVDMKDIPKSQKSFYLDRKAQYSLDRREGPQTLEERNAEWKQRVQRMHEEAQERMSQMRDNQQPSVD